MLLKYHKKINIVAIGITFASEGSKNYSGLIPNRRRTDWVFGGKQKGTQFPGLEGGKRSGPGNQATLMNTNEEEYLVSA